MDKANAIPKHADGLTSDADVLASLEPGQFAGAEKQRYGRRHLSAATLTAMWGLRIYAILMVIVVIYSVVQAFHMGR